MEQDTQVVRLFAATSPFKALNEAPGDEQAFLVEKGSVNLQSLHSLAAEIDLNACA